jgi:hypothetical protein
MIHVLRDNVYNKLYNWVMYRVDLFLFDWEAAAGWALTGHVSATVAVGEGTLSSTVSYHSENNL